MFMKALDQMGKLDDPFFGNIPPDETVKLVFNLSQGEDERGPWNEEPDFEYVENPEPEGGLPPEPINPMTKATSLRLAKPGHPERRTSTRCREGPRLTESATLQRLSDPLGYFFLWFSIFAISR